MLSEPMSILQDCCENTYKVLTTLLGSRKCLESVSPLHFGSKVLALQSFQCSGGGRGIGKRAEARHNLKESSKTGLSTALVLSFLGRGCDQPPLQTVQPNPYPHPLGWCISYAFNPGCQVIRVQAYPFYCTLPYYASQMLHI